MRSRRVRHLFSSGGASAADEQEMDARVGRMAQLLCDPAISSRGGLERMPEALADSHMPQFPHEPRRLPGPPRARGGAAHHAGVVARFIGHP